ncbi:MAG: hypothetical protein M0P76_02210 [Candidatus Pacebacteria bacterium]|nr:hypothetical protein [Candidatus Paceibacterota bacterium]
MAYDNNGGGFTPRPMFQGNWSCSGCGGAIHELPFQPDQERLGQLLCRDCHRAKRGDRDTRGGGNRDNRGPRTMHQGNWSCSGCGTAINELPFEPDESRLGQLLCRDCHRAKRGNM